MDQRAQGSFRKRRVQAPEHSLLRHNITVVRGPNFGAELGN
jgi:hypothetical protein